MSHRMACMVLLLCLVIKCKGKVLKRLTGQIWSLYEVFGLVGYQFHVALGFGYSLGIQPLHSHTTSNDTLDTSRNAQNRL